MHLIESLNTIKNTKQAHIITQAVSPLSIVYFDDPLGPLIIAELSIGFVDLFGIF
jgi:hypothetical protein